MRYLAIIYSGLLLAVAAPCARAEPAEQPPAPGTLLERAARLQAASQNELAMVSSGHDALLLRVHLIRQARRSIDLQTFIWTNDECGRLIMYELIQAAKRGVKVRIIADHMVSDQDPATTAFLATVHPNLKVKHYRPAMSRIKPSLLDNILSGALGFHDINQRMHNKILLAEVTAGRFRDDLYWRLQVVPVNIPPLRARGDDVLLLTEAFLAHHGARYGRALKGLERAVVEAFRRYSWPGNIRELRNVVERLIILSDQKITKEDVEKF